MTATFRLTALGDLDAAEDLVQSGRLEAGDGHVKHPYQQRWSRLPRRQRHEPPNKSSTRPSTLNVKVPFFLVAALAPAMADADGGR